MIDHEQPLHTYDLAGRGKRKTILELNMHKGTGRLQTEKVLYDPDLI
jgi:hypothetical protein